ncbi:hypothetical protein ILYODFUR_034046, partial [Ilyodon furcidens]
DLRSKPESSCNSQPMLQVPALHPAKVKFPGSQGIYLDQVLADSSKPLSSSKRTLLTLHPPPDNYPLSTFENLTRFSSSFTALSGSTSSSLIKLTSIHSKPKLKIIFHLFPKQHLRSLTPCVSSVQSAVSSPGSSILLFKMN